MLLLNSIIRSLKQPSIYLHYTTLYYTIPRMRFSLPRFLPNSDVFWSLAMVHWYQLCALDRYECFDSYMLGFALSVGMRYSIFICFYIANKTHNCIALMIGTWTRICIWIRRFYCCIEVVDSGSGIIIDKNSQWSFTYYMLYLYSYTYSATNTYQHCHNSKYVFI